MMDKSASMKLDDTLSCKSCGSQLTYKAGTDSLKCTHCGLFTKIKVQYAEHVEELDYMSYINKLEDLNNKTVKVVQCNQCGAESTLGENIKSSVCPYCNTVLVESDIHEERLVQPSYLLPFMIEREHVHSYMGKWLKSLWFAPNKLKKQALHTDEMKGIYIPCWTYDAQTGTLYYGQRGDNYTVTVGSGKDKRTEVRTRWTNCSGYVSHFFDDVMVQASRMIQPKVFNKLNVWNTKKLIVHDSKFLTGYITEKYIIRLQDGFEVAKATMEKEIQDLVRRDIGGDSQHISSCKTNYSDIKFKLILLPVYISSYQYNNKLFHFYMNGCNGKITGDRPYSVWKIISFITALAAVMAAVYFYFQIAG